MAPTFVLLTSQIDASHFYCRLQDNNLERAVDWIFSHAHELDSTESQSQANQATGPQYKDGSGSK